ncbi:major facilitator superfamily domain-containing protein 4A-like [Ylistrum balloti]|uniref:major facilitator superfamily domain-containing protein 4A-like n=1 Tax=Ylistrum balloti TaxID=509963 RepID=UPI002905A68B|nr:major facilitator superfamily domain-containing protein 4A-like [Ylistrum balloti]
MPAESSNMEKDSCFPKIRIRYDRSKQQSVIYSICIYFSFFMIGWNRSLFGPSFPDIQQICHIDLELGSWIVTTFYIGYAFGALIAGLLGAFNQNLTFGFSLITLATSVVVTPWCSVYWIMIAAHFSQGFCQGVVDTIGNSEILRIWKNNRLLYFCLELSYAIGCFVSPLVAAPFLMDTLVNQTSLTNISIVYNVTTFNENFRNISIAELLRNASFSPNLDSVNTSSVVIPSATSFQSMIYIPYSLTGILFSCLSTFFFLIYVVDKRERTRRSQETNITETDDHSKHETKGISEQVSGPNSGCNPIARVLPTKVKVFALVTTSILLLFYDGIEEAFAAFLTLYCVDYLKWTSSDGALITAMTNVCGIIAIIGSLFMKCINTIVYAGVNCVLISLSFFGILISSLYYYDIGMWISCCFHGFFKSVLFSLTLTWANEYITPVTGRIASVFMISCCLGAAVNPVILGYIMETYGNIWLCYCFVAEGCVVLFLYFVMVVITRYIVKHFGKTSDTSNTYETAISMRGTVIEEFENDDDDD